MNEQQQKQQKILKYTVIGLAVFSLFVFSTWVIFDHLENQKKTQKIDTTVPQLPLDGIDPQEIWIDQICTENAAVHGRVDYIQTLFDKRVLDEGEKESMTQHGIAALRTEIDHLKEQLKKQAPLQPTVGSHLRDELQKVSHTQQQQSWDPFFALSPPTPQEFITPLSSILVLNRPTSITSIEPSRPGLPPKPSYYLASICPAG